MLGHKMLEVFAARSHYSVIGTVTSLASFNTNLPTGLAPLIREGVFAHDIESVVTVLEEEKPDVVINCIGYIKQKKDADAQRLNIVLNALFPQQVAHLCEQRGIRFITIATDCVFDGQKGSAYFESDLPTCHDGYGMSKYLGELHAAPHLTLRTSIIGHELKGGISLLDWFLSQNNQSVKGYSKAIFSGFPTVELATVLADRIIPDDSLVGLYHLSADPISKYDLLSLIRDTYGLSIAIESDSAVQIDRSLNSDELRAIIQYQPPTWVELVRKMYQDYVGSPFYTNKKGI